MSAGEVVECSVQGCPLVLYCVKWLCRCRRHLQDITIIRACYEEFVFPVKNNNVSVIVSFQTAPLSNTLSDVIELPLQLWFIRSWYVVIICQVLVQFEQLISIVHYDAE